MKNNPNSLYKSFFEDNEKEEEKNCVCKNDDCSVKAPRKKI